MEVELAADHSLLICCGENGEDDQEDSVVDEASIAVSEVLFPFGLFKVALLVVDGRVRARPVESASSPQIWWRLVNSSRRLVDSGILLGQLPRNLLSVRRCLVRALVQALLSLSRNFHYAARI